ncbi:DUF2568 domain-containing protein [uncultured Tessaracoccus sp.]|uniref:DUF2568 domain-containing protein n=1 Tax=uncultured Tessaracoccus sp. TaxID=905023 RepID=UPI00260702EC|nr:DUF2568 domain-containing protein [uncultured Tessaracoccus sp.]
MTAILSMLMFLVELLTWVSIGIVFHARAGGGLVGWIVAVVAVCVVLAGWVRWAAPSSRSRTPAKAAMTKIVVYGIAIVGMASIGHLVFALVLAVSAIVLARALASATRR